MESSLHRTGLTLVTLVAVAQCWPLWQHYWYDSHEYYAYVLRVVEFEAALRQGDLYPRWAADFYGGYGSPFFVFYAPLVFAGSAVLSAVCGSAVVGLKVWLTVASVAAGLGAYVAVRGETRRADAALLASLAYLGSAYRLGNLYIRGDLAEYTALAILPWAAWGYRHVARAVAEEDVVRRGAMAVALHAALLFSHAITGLWGSLLLGLVAVGTTYQLARRSAFGHVRSLWTAFALSLAVASVYIGPALLQKRYVKIAIASSGYYEPSNQLLPLGALESGQFGILPLVSAALVLALAVVCLRRGGTATLAWAVGAAACAFLSTRYAERFWQLNLPLTRFIQFPWRLHGLAALAGAFALGLAWSAVLRRDSWRGPGALVLGACALLVSAPLCRIERPFVRGQFPETTSEIRSGIHHTTADEYLPRWVPAGPSTPAHSLVSSAPYARVTSAWSRGSAHELELVATAASSAELTLHMFPGWRITTLEGPASATLGTSKTGLVSLDLPQPGRYRLALDFGTSPTRASFGVLSLFAALATWGLLRLAVRQRPALRSRRSTVSELSTRMAA